MSKEVFLYFDQPSCNYFRKELRGYCSWIEKKLLPLLNGVDQEVKEEYHNLLEKYEEFFNPEIHDPYDLHEMAYEESIYFGLSLEEINIYMLGMGIVGLYHLWERQVIYHIQKELDHYRFENRPPVTTWRHILNTFSTFSTNLSDLTFYNSLNELRLVVNVIKHGSGDSYRQLIKLNSDILITDRDGKPIKGDWYALISAGIYPQQKHYDRYKAATLAFWDYNTWHEIGDKRHLCPTN